VRRVAGIGWALAGLLSVTACAPAGVSAAPSKTAAGRAAEAEPAAAATKDGTDPVCTKATKVTIVKTGDGYAFSPAKLTIQRGAFLAVTNKSGRVHELSSEPDAGFVTSVLDLKERQVIQFPEAGKFTVDGASGAALRLTVSGESGCGKPKPSVTIADGNAFEPAKLTVRATENFAVVNESGTPQSVRCDPGGNGDNTRLEKDETQLLAIDEPGRYTCASIQHPSKKVVITVAAD
jgi:plastocyanin